MEHFRLTVLTVISRSSQKLQNLDHFVIPKFQNGENGTLITILENSTNTVSGMCSAKITNRKQSCKIYFYAVLAGHMFILHKNVCIFTPFFTPIFYTNFLTNFLHHFCTNFRPFQTKKFFTRLSWFFTPTISLHYNFGFFRQTFLYFLNQFCQTIHL